MSSVSVGSVSSQKFSVVSAPSASQIQSAIEGERARIQSEKERELQEAINNAIPDHERTVRSLREELGAERDRYEQKLRQVTSLKQVRETPVVSEC